MSVRAWFSRFCGAVTLENNLITTEHYVIVLMSSEFEITV